MCEGERIREREREIGTLIWTPLGRTTPKILLVLKTDRKEKEKEKKEGEREGEI